MTAPKTQKIGGREFVVFADGLVPVDLVRSIEPERGLVRVELTSDSRPCRFYRPLLAAAPSAPEK